MKQFLIEDVRVGISKGGIACGPVPGAVIGEVKLRSEDGNIIYHCLAEVDGTLNFYESEFSTYQGQLEEDFDNEEFNELMEQSYTGGYCSYDEFYEELGTQLPLNNTAVIRKYLAYMVRADWDEISRFKAATIGKHIGDVIVPICDAEEEYLEAFEEDE